MMRKSKITIALFIFAILLGPVNTISWVADVAAQQQQTAPRKYIIKPLNLGTNTEIRARSTRNLQVQVTDENDRPLPDVPLLLLLSGLAAGGGGGLSALAGQAGSSAIQGLAGQTGLRVVTNSYGIANASFTAPDSVGKALRLLVRVEGTDTVWESTLDVGQAEAISEPAQNTAPPENTSSLPLEAEEKDCLDIINKFRAENLQPPIKASPKLMQAAKWLSQDNADNKPDDPDHTDSQGRDVGKRLADFGYRADIIKENIVVGAQSAAQAMAVWTASGFHIRNMLNAEVKRIGISRVCKKGARLGCHWTVILASTDE